MPAPEVAVAYVSVVPSVHGFANSLRRQIVGPTTTASRTAGQNAGSAFGSALKKGVAAAGAVTAAAVGALGVSAVRTAGDFEGAMNRVKAVSGATGKEFSQLEGMAKKLGSTTQFSATEAAEAMGFLAMAGFDAKDTMTALPGVLDLAAAGAIGLGDAADIASNILSGYGMKTKEIGRLNDVLAKTFTSSNVDMRMLGETFKYVGPVAASAGLKFEEVSAAVGLLGNAGIQGSEAGTALRGSIAMLLKPSAEAQKAMNRLGLQVTDTNGDLRPLVDIVRQLEKSGAKTADMMTIFGVEAGPSMQALVSQGSKALSGLTKDLEKSGGTAKKIATTQNEGFNGAVKSLKSAWEGLLLAVADSGLLSGVTKVTDGMAKFIQRLVESGKVTKAVRSSLLGLWAVAKKIGGGMSDAFAWAKKYQGWLLPFAAGVSAVAVSIGAYKLGVSAVSAVTRAWTAAQAALNLVMNANPVALIALAIIGLGAALVVAYKRSETFRGIVQALWSGFMAGARAVGTGLKWLWGVVSGVFGFIGKAARVLLTAVVTVAILPIVLAFKALAAVTKWLWNAAIKPAFGWIAGRAKWLWKSAILPAFNGIKAVFRGLATAAKWLYNAAIKPAFAWIANRAKWLWRNAILPAFNGIKSVFRGAATAAKWLYNSAIRPAFNWIADKGKWLWRSALKPAFDAMKKGVSLVGKSFNTAKNAIAKAWGKVSGIAKKPVAFVVNTVYGKGIRPVWNKVASAFGATKLPSFKFASGGIMPGYTPGRDVHRFFSPTGGTLDLSGGEAIMRPEVTRALGAGGVNSLNAAARSGGVGAVRRMLGGPHQAFKDGGIFGWLSGAASTVKGWGSAAWDKVKKGARWLKETIAGSARAGVKAVVNPLIDRIPGLQGDFGKMVKKIPLKMVDSMFGYSEKADKKMETAIPAGLPGGSGVKRWTPYVLKALAMLGQPRSYLGITLRRMNQESGGNPRAINNWDINARNGMASRGLMQVIPPTFNAYAGKLRSRGIWDPLANIYASMRYALARYGSLPRAYNRAGGYDSGGWLQPGDTLAMNRTGKPEPILNPSQWRSMATLAQRGAEGTGGGLQPGDRLILSIDGRTELEAYVDRRADTRIRKGLTAPAALGRKL